MTKRPNPYVGPRSFSTEEHLFGRDREITELVDLLLAERIVLLYSPSGAGKTSLVQAGLMPALQRKGFQVRPVMRTGLEPPRNNGFAFSGANRYVLSCLMSVQDRLPAEKQRDIKDLAGMGFEEYLGEANDDELLIFDQFEEVLVVDPVNRSTKEEFFAQIGSALRNRNRSALFVIREDYVAPLDPYLRPIPTRLKNTYRLDLLAVEAALAAIQNPAALAGVQFEDEAARRLADDLRRVQVQLPDGSTASQLGPYVEPVQLQVVCRRLWGSLPEDSERIRPGDVAAVANVDNALADYYAESTRTIAQGTGVSERAIRDWIEQRLISKQGIRGQVLQGQDESEGLKNDAVWRLVGTHLIRSEKRNEATWFELAHDRPIQPIRADNAVWREAHLSPVQKRAALWASQNRPASLLLKDTELREAEQWAAAQSSITEVEQSFLEGSATAQKIAEKQRRQQRFIAALAVVSTVVGILAVIAAVYAANQYKIASSRELAASSERVVQSSHELGLALARKAIQVKNTEEAEEALQLAVQFVQGPRFQGHIDTVNSISMTPDGSLMTTASDDHAVKLWRVAQADDTELMTLGDRALRAVFSLDGSRIAVAGADGTVKLVDARSKANMLNFPTSPAAVTDIAFSRDGKLVASGGDDNRAIVWGPLPAAWNGQSEFAGRIQVFETSSHIRSLSFIGANRLATASAVGRIEVWDTGSGARITELKGHTGPVNAIAFDAKRGLIATGGDDGTVRLWNADSYTGAGAFDASKDVSAVAFSPDDKALAAVSFLDGTTKVWDLDSKREIVHLPAVKPINQEKLKAVAFLPPGHEMLAVAADSSVRVYDLNLQRLDRKAAELLKNSKPIPAGDCERYFHKVNCNALR